MDQRVERREMSAASPAGPAEIGEGSAPATARRTGAATRRVIWAAARAMRPEQWTKNGLTLLAAVFSRTILDGPTLARVAVGFAAFSLAASGVYLVNDLTDRSRDQLHPRTRLRPIASGALSPRAAGGLAAALFAGA